MLKKLFFFLALISLKAFSQVDTLIDNGLYKTLYSTEYLSPIFVEYKIFKGGGDCNRSQFRFEVDSIIPTATDKDFLHSGYDKGHLVPAEDFAFDCSQELKTFYYYNVMAQYPNLNRGIWKTYELKIRKQSQSDSLVVYCGGIYEDNYVINQTGVHVPVKCWKVVKSLSTGNVIYCLLFTNEKEVNSVKKITIDQLKKLIGDIRGLNF